MPVAAASPRAAATAPVVAAAFIAAPGSAPPPAADDPFPPRAINPGLPPSIRLQWSPFAGYDFERDEGSAHVALEGASSLAGLLPSFLDATLEGAAGAAGGSFEALAAARLGLPWLRAGMVYSSRREDLAFGLTLRVPLRRGGLLGRGDLFRIDYEPEWRQLRAGILFPSPFDDYRKTRPVSKSVRLPADRFPDPSPPPSPASGRTMSPGDHAARPPADTSSANDALEDALGQLHHAVHWLARLTTPRFAPGDRFDASAGPIRDHVRVAGHSAGAEADRYHRELDRAFTIALAGDSLAARALAREAEALVLARVVIPFNRDFGCEKEPADAGGHCARALAAFDSLLAAGPVSAPGAASVAGPASAPGSASVAGAASVAGPAPEDSARRAAVREIFRQILADIRQAAAESGHRWGGHDLRLAWLPLEYGVRNGQWDTQAEWDHLLGQLTGSPFTDANTIRYLMVEQQHFELKRMLRETEDYEVTIIHDFRSESAGGATDLYGWDMVADGYIAAFTQAVRDLDAGRRKRLPQYFLFIDEHYYRQNRERGILHYLEELYRPPGLSLRTRELQAQVEAAHDTLRAAIADSPRLAGLPEKRLAELFRVHVCVTNPFDPSFGLDVIRRDHRKFAFRDADESDPAAGVALVTGQGIGEHYNGPGWEDRSLVVRGPALISMKSAARRLLLSQGYRPEDVPESLRPHPFPADYAERCAGLRAAGWETPVSVVLNETGFGDKRASVLKAAIYNLAPDSSTVLGFDSLWLSDFWAGMFTGAALRGARMFAMGPTPSNAPSNSGQVLHLLRENLDRLFRAQGFFRDEVEAAGGRLRVGLYAHEEANNDFRRRAAAMLRSRASQPFLRQQFPLPPAVDSLLAGFGGQYEAVPMMALRLRPRPYLHLKFQFFATWEGFEIFRHNEWAPVLHQHLAVRQRQLQGLQTEGVTPSLLKVRSPADPGAPGVLETHDRWLEERSPGSSERVIFTSTIGSHNQNPRSLLLDGEVSVAVSGASSLITAPDFIFNISVAEWPSTRAEFDRLFPKQHPSPWTVPFLGILRDLD